MGGSSLQRFSFFLLLKWLGAPLLFSRHILVRFSTCLIGCGNHDLIYTFFSYDQLLLRPSLGCVFHDCTFHLCQARQMSWGCIALVAFSGWDNEHFMCASELPAVLSTAHFFLESTSVFFVLLRASNTTKRPNLIQRIASQSYFEHLGLGMREKTHQGLHIIGFLSLLYAHTSRRGCSSFSPLSRYDKAYEGCQHFHALSGKISLRSSHEEQRKPFSRHDTVYIF